VQGGVVLGADTRSTAGTVVADKNCEKIHFIADNIYCCGAGTAADTEHVTEMVASHLKLHKYATGRQAKVITALTLLKQHLFKYQGHISAALVLGGYDFNGPHLFTVRTMFSKRYPSIADKSAQVSSALWTVTAQQQCENRVLKSTLSSCTSEPSNNA
jgi:hypothetical protein